METKISYEELDLLRDQIISHVVEMRNRLDKIIKKKAKNDESVTQEDIDERVKALLDAEKASNIAWKIDY